MVGDISEILKYDGLKDVRRAMRDLTFRFVTCYIQSLSLEVTMIAARAKSFTFAESSITSTTNCHSRPAAYVLLLSDTHHIMMMLILRRVSSQ